MDLIKYFETAHGTGVLSTADSDGKVNSAIYGRPHVFDDGTIAFLMRQKLTHHNLQSNPYASFLFHESGPGQQPEFDEYTLVLRGMLRVKTKEESLDVREGEAVIVKGGEWVQYSTPEPDGAEYVAVCLPAFSPETVHRDESMPQ